MKKSYESNLASATKLKTNSNSNSNCLFRFQVSNQSRFCKWLEMKWKKIFSTIPKMPKSLMTSPIAPTSLKRSTKCWNWPCCCCCCCCCCCWDELFQNCCCCYWGKETSYRGECHLPLLEAFEPSKLWTDFQTPPAWSIWLRTWTGRTRCLRSRTSCRPQSCDSTSWRFQWKTWKERSKKFKNIAKRI